MKIDASDRRILLVAFSILAITLLISAAVSSAGDEASQYPSPYSASSGGAKAAYTLLSQIGYQVEHWRQPPAKLLEHGTSTVLVIAVPTENPSSEERQDLLGYVRAGGKVLAIGSNTISFLPHAAVLPDIPHFARQTYRALVPSGITRDAPRIAMTPALYWRPDDAASEVEYGDDGHGEIVSFRYGKGQMVWWSAADPLTNSGITQESNLQLLLNSLGPAGSRTVLWDDYFHEGERTLAESLLASPLKWSLLQLGLLALVVLFTHSRRHGPVCRLPQTSRLATLEFVETLGALYERADATELPVEIAYERFRHRLHRKLGISTSDTSEQVVSRASARLGNLASECEKVLKECESARYRTDIAVADSLRLVKSLELFSEQLQIDSKNKGEK